MKSENKNSGNDHPVKLHTNNYNNEISSGNIGSESGFDNGASTLRALQKKHAEKATIKSPRKPML